MRTISIGDIHGRECWKEVIKDVDTYDKIIFVGDYVDSFNVPAVIQKHNLKEIIEFKKSYPDKVVLLLGNHDIQYMLYPQCRCSGFQAVFQIDFTQIFRENRELFQAAFQIDNYLWTHAGVHTGWYRDYCRYTNPHKPSWLTPKMELSEIINHYYLHNDHGVFNVGWMRGGTADVGGPFWLDRRNAWKKPIDGYHQIFGHTYISDGHIKHLDINENTSVTCVDTLKDFNPNFYIKEI